MAKYRLSNEATIFWDLGQELENQKLLQGEEKELKETQAVRQAKQFNYLVLVEESEPKKAKSETPDEAEPEKKKK
jgi:hypothetical protein